MRDYRRIEDADIEQIILDLQHDIQVAKREIVELSAKLAIAERELARADKVERG